MGYGVLVVPVPDLDAWVRERTAFYDASFVSVDPGFVHAHITLLGPWLADPSPDDLDAVGAIAARTAAFAFTLARIAEFPDGLIHLRPEPAAPFSELTALLAEAFPQCPPYEGRYADLVPHLTLDRRSAAVTAESVEASLGDLLPVEAKANRIDLQWWDNHDCRLLHTWELR